MTLELPRQAREEVKGKRKREQEEDNEEEKEEDEEKEEKRGRVLIFLRVPFSFGRSLLWDLYLTHLYILATQEYQIAQGKRMGGQ